MDSRVLSAALPKQGYVPRGLTKLVRYRTAGYQSWWAEPSLWVNFGERTSEKKRLLYPPSALIESSAILLPTCTDSPMDVLPKNGDGGTAKWHGTGIAPAPPNSPNCPEKASAPFSSVRL